MPNAGNLVHLDMWETNSGADVGNCAAISLSTLLSRLEMLLCMCVHLHKQVHDEFPKRTNVHNEYP